MIWRNFSSNFVTKFWLFPFRNWNSSERFDLLVPGSPDHYHPPQVEEEKEETIPFLTNCS